MMNYSRYQTFDSDVVNDLIKIDKNIKEEYEKGEEMDQEELLRLKTLQLYRGMELNSGVGFNNNKRGIPY